MLGQVGLGDLWLPTVSLTSPSSVYWDYAVTIRLEEIVYLHCHQQGRNHGESRWLSDLCGTLSLLPATPRSFIQH